MYTPTREHGPQCTRPATVEIASYIPPPKQGPQHTRLSPGKGGHGLDLRPSRHDSAPMAESTFPSPQARNICVCSDGTVTAKVRAYGSVSAGKAVSCLRFRKSARPDPSPAAIPHKSHPHKVQTSPLWGQFPSPRRTLGSVLLLGLLHIVRVVEKLRIVPPPPP